MNTCKPSAPRFHAQGRPHDLRGGFAAACGDRTSRPARQFAGVTRHRRTPGGRARAALLPDRNPRAAPAAGLGAAPAGPLRRRAARRPSRRTRGATPAAGGTPSANRRGSGTAVRRGGTTGRSPTPRRLPCRPAAAAARTPRLAPGPARTPAPAAPLLGVLQVRLPADRR